MYEPAKVVAGSARREICDGAVEYTGTGDAEENSCIETGGD